MADAAPRLSSLAPTRTPLKQKKNQHQTKTKQDGSTWWGAFDFASDPFDWGDDDLTRPRTPGQELVVYEMPVRCFTADPSSGVPSSRRGGWLGVADRADHLQALGITAVELLPVFEYDELEFRRWRNPREHMTNVWGYSHVSFFSPMARFGSKKAQRAGDPSAAAREFKQMVKELHARGIQVILDVVYNHTAELDDENPYTIHFR
jgi:isoamylase